jgi:alkylation response protein AidB-like acyl-CoA dehydrogenase
MSDKQWGNVPYFGLSSDWDPNWILTPEQIELRDLLISLCEQEIRGNAAISDDKLKYPRRNLELLGEHGFLALCVPKEYGGLGQDHVGFAMVA